MLIGVGVSCRILYSIVSYLYTERQESCTAFSFDFFWIKIDDLKNQCSLFFMPVPTGVFVISFLFVSYETPIIIENFPKYSLESHKI